MRVRLVCYWVLITGLVMALSALLPEITVDVDLTWPAQDAVNTLRIGLTVSILATLPLIAMNLREP